MDKLLQTIWCSSRYKWNKHGDERAFHTRELIDKLNDNIADTIEQNVKLSFNDNKNSADSPDYGIDTFSSTDRDAGSTSIISTNNDYSVSISLNVISNYDPTITIGAIKLDDA